MADRASFLHQPFYCEENIYHLARDPAFARRGRHVVFITNEARTVAIWEQRAAGRRGEAVVWDYHVVLLVQAPWEVWDLDTWLPLPTPLEDYLQRSFSTLAPPELSPRFRVVEADLFIDVFASDRAHMREPSGSFRAPPPPWAPVGRSGVDANLDRFIDVGAPFHGEVVDLAGLRALVGAH